MTEIAAYFGTLDTLKWEGHEMVTRTRGQRIKLWPPDHLADPFAGATWPVECDVGGEADAIQKRIDDAAENVADDSLTLTRDDVDGLTEKHLVALIRRERPDWEVTA